MHFHTDPFSVERCLSLLYIIPDHAPHIHYIRDIHMYAHISHSLYLSSHSVILCCPLLRFLWEWSPCTPSVLFLTYNIQPSLSFAFLHTLCQWIILETNYIWKGHGGAKESCVFRLLIQDGHAQCSLNVPLDFHVSIVSVLDFGGNCVM